MLCIWEIFFEKFERFSLKWNEDNLKNADYLKYGDGPKNKDNPKNEDNLNNEDTLKWWQPQKGRLLQKWRQPQNGWQPLEWRRSQKKDYIIFCLHSVSLGNALTTVNVQPFFSPKTFNEQLWSIPQNQFHVVISFSKYNLPQYFANKREKFPCST